MMFRRLRLLHKNQRGFTLIEMLMVIAISGIITAGLALSVMQVFNGNAQSSSKMLVIRQVQNAGYFISRDVPMAQSLTLGVSSGFPITMEWTEFGVGGAEHQIVYSVVGDEIKREHYTNGFLDTTSFVARYIDVTETSCSFDGNVLSVTVTASIGGYRPATETRTYEIVMRPNNP